MFAPAKTILGMWLPSAAMALRLTTQPILPTTLPGNVQFDPLGLARVDVFDNRRTSREAREILHDYREAEIKHGRLAMLAAVAYPAQEIINPWLSDAFGLPNLLPMRTLSPSLVNGGLEPAIVLFFVGLGAGLEFYKRNVADPSLLPADYRFRLCASRPGTPEFRRLQAGEIWNGRLAMIAVLGYVTQEATTKLPVVLA